ncbi:MAG: glycine--tRNA ligase, partial [Candidatus Thermoplasmatota archaeon]|nr:glycine--tRNA ligase [Candidatus Thermoplasmatota archaeon]
DLTTVIQSSDEIHLIPDPEGQIESVTEMTIASALEKGIIRHPIVGKFMLETYELLITLGIDPQRIRFRQHEQDEMAHYASDCWDCEIHGSYGWIECVGIAHRGCYDLDAHSRSTSSSDLKAWREFDNPVNIDENRWVPIQASIGPFFRQDAADVIQSLQALEAAPDSLPFELQLSNGKTVTIDNGMVELRRIQKTINGEWFTPHVIEPAFGIDRIVWHILDHSFDRTEKEGETYDILRLREEVAPYDAVVLPLFNKDGMPEMANQIYNQMCSTKGIVPTIDAFGKSIGRRYARADEIGIPWAITIDHQSTTDNTVTVRKRDNQQQIRMDVQQLISFLSNGNLS